MNDFRESSQRCYDLIILGAGVAGALLGSILGRQGISVLILDAGSHPRFAIGESTVPLSTLFIELLSRRYGVPELMSLSSPELYLKNVGSTCGVKGNFGYVYHQEGSPQRADQAQQLGVSKFFRHDELHYYRQDTDAFLARLAIQTGCVLRQNVAIQDVQLGEAGVEVTSSRGERFKGRYLVDCTGFRSVLAKKLALHETPSTLQHHSRSIFTHMLGVRPYDEISDASTFHGMPTPWFSGTLHHVFDGGWLWVIPFNNLKGSTNPLCSVGLTVDPRRHPKSDQTPEEEFNAFLGRFPEVARQFERARPAREWVATDRLQYSSRQSVGDRWCLMSHAAGFVDPFYSRGLVNTMEVINAFAARMVEAVKDGDFSRARFLPVETLQDNLIRHNDALVNCSYLSFRDYGLWNAFLRVWVLGTYGVEAHFHMALEGIGSDETDLTALDHTDHPGWVCPFGDWYRNLFDAASGAVLAVDRGERTAAEATAQIFEAIRSTDYAGSWWATASGRPLWEKISNPAERDLFYAPEKALLERRAQSARRAQAS